MDVRRFISNKVQAPLHLAPVASQHDLGFSHMQEPISESSANEQDSARLKQSKAVSREQI
jgi:hypothetical protein